MKEQLTIAQAKESIKDIPDWKVDEECKIIYREYVMKNFMAAINLINEIAKIAEKENHHPDIHLTNYRMLRVELTTHETGGLSEQDFTEAAEIDKLPADLKH